MLKKSIKSYIRYIVLICGIMISMVLGCNDDVDSNKKENQKPNILIISVDNLGYGDLQIYNKDSQIKTPHIDHFAKQGARLTSFYTASPTCSVSRAALLTGRIPQRNKLENQLAGVKGNYGIGLRHSEILIPEIIKKAVPEYATGAFGKWNIGFASGSKPTDRGFDSFFGHVSGNIDYYSHFYNDKHDLYKNDKEIFRTGQYSSDLFANEAIKFIKEKTNEETPWFVYLPFNAPHFPNAASKKPGQASIYQAPDWAFAEVYGLSPDEPDPNLRYSAVVTALDNAIGNVFKSLDSLKISDDTFVFLFSDNGSFRLGRPFDIGTNYPLREGGVTCWEGGLRVPALVRWPNKIKANSTINTTLWTPDLLIACSKLSRVELPKDIVFDGKDPLPVLEGETEVSPHEALFFQYKTHSALRSGDWKIIRTNPENPWQLFNIREDISETKNRANEQPDVLERLVALFNIKRKELSGNS